MSQHTITCQAYAIGCAVENLRDAVEEVEPTTTPDPIAIGLSYLDDGTASCRCEDGVSAYGVATLAHGYAAMDAAAVTA